MKGFFIKCLYPLLKMAKPYLRKWAAEVAIPKLQKKINAGAIDKKVDTIIDKSINGLIDAI
jgi:hypothetical protein